MTSEITSHFSVFTTRNYVENKQIKTHWHRLGTAFKNADGSINLLLWSLPLTDPKTGLARLQLRQTQPKETLEKQDTTPTSVEETPSTDFLIEDDDSFIMNFAPCTPWYAREAE